MYNHAHFTSRPQRCVTVKNHAHFTSRPQRCVTVKNHAHFTSRPQSCVTVFRHAHFTSRPHIIIPNKVGLHGLYLFSPCRRRIFTRPSHAYNCSHFSCTVRYSQIPTFRTMHYSQIQTSRAQLHKCIIYHAFTETLSFILRRVLFFYRQNGAGWDKPCPHYMRAVGWGCPWTLTTVSTCTWTVSVREWSAGTYHSPAMHCLP